VTASCWFSADDALSVGFRSPLPVKRWRGASATAKHTRPLTLSRCNHERPESTQHDWVALIRPLPPRNPRHSHAIKLHGRSRDAAASPLPGHGKEDEPTLPTNPRFETIILVGSAEGPSVTRHLRLGQLAATLHSDATANKTQGRFRNTASELLLSWLTVIQEFCYAIPYKQGLRAEVDLSILFQVMESRSWQAPVQLVDRPRRRLWKIQPRPSFLDTGTGCSPSKQTYSSRVPGCPKLERRPSHRDMR